jgi:hypothetical protein
MRIGKHISTTAGYTATIHSGVLGEDAKNNPHLTLGADSGVHSVRVGGYTNASGFPVADSSILCNLEVQGDVSLNSTNPTLTLGAATNFGQITAHSLYPHITLSNGQEGSGINDVVIGGYGDGNVGNEHIENAAPWGVFCNLTVNGRVRSTGNPTGFMASFQDNTGSGGTNANYVALGADAGSSYITSGFSQSQLYLWFDNGPHSTGAFVFNRSGIFYAADSVQAAGVTLTSDDRIKHNEQPLINCLSTIEKLKPQAYDKGFEQIPEDWQKEIGFIAQDIEEIPELEHLVSTTDTRLYEKDEDGNSTTEVKRGYEDHKYLNYTGIFTYLVGAVQELSQKVKILEGNVEGNVA